jgi:4,5-DOPA dioxygenase extradiol
MMPAVFMAHGAPPLLDDAVWTRELADWGQTLPPPSALLVLSAHWERRPITLGTTRTMPLVYDFYGFPERFYRLTYPAPGAPALAARVRALLAPLGPVADEPERGLDHGVWTPLIPMFPRADVPVLQLSLPSLAPHELFAVGRALAPLRHEGVLIAGSGHLTHNLRMVDFSPNPPTPTWAAEFDAWVGDALERKDVDALLDYRRRGPGVQQSLPTHEHFVPVLATLGAAIDSPDQVTFPIRGWLGGSLTKRSVQIG